ncbi:DUF1013 domain-containing protein [bacterium]|nr:DUF1013 domain-containing protein [bacterium]
MPSFLMPKATAVWLIENTGLTFEQIGDVCGLHWLEVKVIADSETNNSIRASDPVANEELSREEIAKGEADPSYRLKALPPKHQNLPQTKRKGARFTPVSRRKDRPDAIAWFLRHHPEITDPQIARLIGTTKPTIESVRARTHTNMANIKPVDPVTLGLCSQIELDELVSKAASKKSNAAAERDARLAGPTLRRVAPPPPKPAAPEADDEDPDAPRREVSAEEVFARFDQSSGKDD